MVKQDSKFKFDYNNTFAWYAIHTKSGEEERVKTRIEKLRDTRDLEPYVEELFIPYETIQSVKDDKVIEEKRKIYPTYVFGKIKMTDEVWYIIRNTQDVYGFIGSAGKHGKPTPFVESEINDLKRRCGIPIKVDLNFDVGDNVLILEGLFKDRVGKVSSIYEDKATVIVSMFNRDTPVEVETYNLQRYVEEE